MCVLIAMKISIDLKHIRKERKELIQDFHEAVDDYLELCAGK